MFEEHMQFTDAEFEKQFSDTTLLKKQFTHDAHLRLAWIHVSKYGEQQAILNLTSQIKAYVSKLGLAHKYVESTTIAAVRLVHSRYVKQPKASYSEFITSNPDLHTHFQELIQEYL